MVQKFLKQVLMFFCPCNGLVGGHSIVFSFSLSRSCTTSFVTLLCISRGSHEVVERGSDSREIADVLTAITQETHDGS